MASAPLPLRPGSADDRGNRFAVTGGRSDSSKQSSLSTLFLASRRAREADAGSGGSSCRSAAGGLPDEGEGGGSRNEVVGGGKACNRPRDDDNDNKATLSARTPPPCPIARIVDNEPSTAAAPVAAGHGSPDSYPAGGGGGTREAFVDRLIALAAAPGQLRTEALGLLTRIGRSYAAHLSGGGGAAEETTTRPGDDRAREREMERKRWEHVSALLLRCFADPDQNLRLHALKVLEALLLARAERSAAEAAAAASSAVATGVTSGAAARTEADTARRAPSPPSRVVAAAGAGAASDAEEDGGGGRWSFSNGEKKAVGLLAMVKGGSGGGESEGQGGGLWRDLVQKHLQRALEDPYHGVRAVACSCHGCLLDSDWEAFSERERDRCLDRVLAATKDRAAGACVA